MSKKPRTPVSEYPLAFIDTETTGLDPLVHEIIEFSIITPTTCLTRKVKPEFIYRASPTALEINGYSEEGWANAISKKAAVDLLYFHLKGHIMAGQNIAFDRGFVKALFQEVGREDEFNSLQRRTLELMSLVYEHLSPHGIKSLSLSETCRFLKITVNNAHTAFDDCLRTKQCFERLLRPSRLDRYVRFPLLGMDYRRRFP